MATLCSCLINALGAELFWSKNGSRILPNYAIELVMGLVSGLISLLFLLFRFVCEQGFIMAVKHCAI